MDADGQEKTRIIFIIFILPNFSTIRSTAKKEKQCGRKRKGRDVLLGSPNIRLKLQKKFDESIQTQLWQLEKWHRAMNNFEQ